MLNVEIIRSSSAWSNCVMQFGIWDIGHTYEFHALSARNGEGSPILFAVRNKAGVPIMIWPGLLRVIENHDGFDLTSVYGYSGPIIREPDIFAECYNAVIDKMRTFGIISAFSRMHPVLGKTFAENCDDCEINGVIVLIDVEHQNETLKSYSAGLRYDIRKLKKLGLELEIDEKAAQVEDFRIIYIDAMASLDAEKYYFFEKTYFSALAKTKRWSTMLIFAKYNDIRIGAGLFIVHNNMMHYYLGATVEGYKRLSPLKMILERAHEIAIQKKMDYVMLGGGVGGKEDDLFRFKCRFGKKIMPFHLVKKIIDNEAYAKICETENLVPNINGFFPTYRASFIDEFE